MAAFGVAVSRRRPLNNYLIVLSLIGLCIIFSWITWQGGLNLTFDDLNYLTYAKQILAGTFSPLQSTYAFGYLLPYTLAGALAVGLPAWLPALLEYIGLILLTYLISLRISNSRLIAYCVAVIALSSCFICVYATRALPDLLSAFIIALAICISLDNTRRHWLYAGMLFGLLAFIKLGSLAIALPFLIGLLIYNKPVLPFLIGLFIIVLIYFASIGFNFAIISHYQQNQISLSQANLISNFLTLFVFISPFPYVSSMQTFGLGLLFLLALLGVYIAWLKKEKAYAMWSFILLFAILYMLFGSESLSHYVPITIVSRYFEILVPVFAILCSYALKVIYEGIESRYSTRDAIAALISIVAISVMVEIPLLWYFHYVVGLYYGSPIN